MKYYLAGPMSGIPHFNFPMFIAVATILRSRGYDIISPAELDSPEDCAAALASLDGYQASDGTHTHTAKTWGDFLSRDVKIVADEVGGIIFLPGWQHSRGAKTEAFVGVQCKHEFYEWIEGELHRLTTMDVIAMITEVPE